MYGYIEHTSKQQKKSDRFPANSSPNTPGYSQGLRVVGGMCTPDEPRGP